MPFPSSVLRLSVECLPVIKTKGSGKAVSGDWNPDIYRIPSSNTSCKQSSVSCLRTRVALLTPLKTVVAYVALPGLAPHPRRKKSILHWLTLTAHCYTICYVFVEGFASS